jgi:hypothetical protein
LQPQANVFARIPNGVTVPLTEFEVEFNVWLIVGWGVACGVAPCYQLEEKQLGAVQLYKVLVEQISPAEFCGLVNDFNTSLSVVF